MNNTIQSILNDYSNNDILRFEMESFEAQIVHFFLNHPGFICDDKSVVHSIKSRFKLESHLQDKLERKKEDGRVITLENYLTEVTDLIGVRVLYLYQDQFEIIHNQIMNQIGKDWALFEEPIAYTWDPEAIKTYDRLGIKHEVKESFYTSVHYVIRPNNSSSQLCCEIQVRTLFEEIWGEIDHTINYPHKTDSVACREQLKVLAKLIGSGTRLADSIFRSYREYEGLKA